MAQDTSAFQETAATRIPPAEIQFLNRSLRDEGRFFRWNGKLMRAIGATHAHSVRQLLSSGVIDALVKEGVFVPSRLTQYNIDGFELVIEHPQMVGIVSYPWEWSFSMLKEAALCMLRVNEIAGRFGYRTKECQPYQVRFAGETAWYMGLESFIPLPKGDISLSSDEFLRAYYYPLKIWSSVGVTWGSRVVPRPGVLLDTEEYLRCRWPIFRWVLAEPLGKFISKFYRVSSWSDAFYRDVKKRHSTWTVFWAERGRTLGRSLTSIENMRRRIQRVTRRADKTAWSNYQGGFARQNDGTLLTPRFQFIADLLISLGASSILEIAGNQGLLSRALKRMNPCLHITCTDADESALDAGFCAGRDEDAGVNWAVLNPMFNEHAGIEESPAVRFQADAVVVMALSHHLVLSNGYRLEWVLDQLAQYCRTYMLIEFMPIGVTTPNAPRPPEWYTQAWFKREFEVRFDLIHCTPLEENRVLFVGAKKVCGSINLRDSIENATESAHVEKVMDCR